MADAYSEIVEHFDMTSGEVHRSASSSRHAYKNFENGLRILVEQTEDSGGPEFQANLPSGKTLRGPATIAALQSVIDKEAS